MSHGFTLQGVVHVHTHMLCGVFSLKWEGVLEYKTSNFFLVFTEIISEENDDIADVDVDVVSSPEQTPLLSLQDV